MTAHPLTSPNTLSAPRGAVRVEAGEAVGTGRVAVVVVTWNRAAAVGGVLRALSRQTFDPARLDVVIIDNASSDGTSETIVREWRPERVVRNATDRAEAPVFTPEPVAPGLEGNAGGFGSLSLVRNAHNLGGCGGFNTGFAFVERVLDGPGTGAGPEFVWLVDDDVDLPPDALERLHSTFAGEPDVGVVGSRTVDLHDGQTTIETTIYFNEESGHMTDEPPESHRLHAAHRAWVGRVGGTRGRRAYSGVLDVDIVSACSLLARWSAVRAVGYWDPRFFIYCDDADWCLRMRRAGYRVRLNLDAVVFHTPWMYKLTPERIYYSQRNIVWMLEKALAGPRRAAVVSRWLGSILDDCRRASYHRRVFHAEIIRRTAHDIVTGRGGKLDAPVPKPEPVVDALARLGALGASGRILVLCPHERALGWADELRGHVAGALIDAGRAADQPSWTYVVRNDVPDAAWARASPERRRRLPARVVYSARRRSKLRRQLGLILRRPHAVVVFDQTNDYPLVAGRWTLHVDRKKPTLAQVERDGVRARARFAARWAWTAALCATYVLRLRRGGAAQAPGDVRGP